MRLYSSGDCTRRFSFLFCKHLVDGCHSGSYFCLQGNHINSARPSGITLISFRITHTKKNPFPFALYAFLAFILHPAPSIICMRACCTAEWTVCLGMECRHRHPEKGCCRLCGCFHLATLVEAPPEPVWVRGGKGTNGTMELQRRNKTA